MLAFCWRYFMAHLDIDRIFPDILPMDHHQEKSNLVVEGIRKGLERHILVTSEDNDERLLRVRLAIKEVMDFYNDLLRKKDYNRADMVVRDLLEIPQANGED